MKSIIIYSGKGGVGKTTVTANLARLLASQGKRVFVIDADINTPSMNTEFDGEHPTDNIWVHSSGNIFQKFIYLEKSMVRRYLEDAKKKLNKLDVDYVLIDTPPSVTNIHIELLKRLSVSYILFVTQPTKLSIEDVTRTMDFFRTQCGKFCKAGVVENMCSNANAHEYSIPLIAQIPFQNGLDTSNLLDNAKDEFQKIANEISSSGEVVLTSFSTDGGYDESFDVISIRETILKNSRTIYVLELKYDNGDCKELKLPALKFLSCRTWAAIYEFIQEEEAQMPFGHWDKRMEACGVDRVSRLVNAFEGDDNALFMVNNAPSTEVQLITGEIGLCSLLTNETSHFGIPRVKYQTSKGSITLFPDEVMPVSINELQYYLNNGYTPLSDGRYIPSKEELSVIYNTFGERVGLMENWEEVYDSWVNP